MPLSAFGIAGNPAAVRSGCQSLGSCRLIFVFQSRPECLRSIFSSFSSPFVPCAWWKSDVRCGGRISQFPCPAPTPGRQSLGLGETLRDSECFPQFCCFASGLPCPLRRDSVTYPPRSAMRADGCPFPLGKRQVFSGFGFIFSIHSAPSSTKKTLNLSVSDVLSSLGWQ